MLHGMSYLQLIDCVIHTCIFCSLILCPIVLVSHHSLLLQGIAILASLSLMKSLTGAHLGHIVTFQSQFLPSINKFLSRWLNSIKYRLFHPKPCSVFQQKTDEPFFPPNFRVV